MKVSDAKMRMAYALGGATCEKKVENKKIELGMMDPDWDGYLIIGHGSIGNANNSYDLWYRGDHGCEKGFTRLMKLDEGWGLNHTVVMFLNAIQMHKSEKKNKT